MAWPPGNKAGMTLSIEFRNRPDRVMMPHTIANIPHHFEEPYQLFPEGGGCVDCAGWRKRKGALQDGPLETIRMMTSAKTVDQLLPEAKRKSRDHIILTDKSAPFYSAFDNCCDVSFVDLRHRMGSFRMWSVRAERTRNGKHPCCGVGAHIKLGKASMQCITQRNLEVAQ